MNTNAIHNIINLISMIIGSLMLFDWASLGLAPQTVATISSTLLFANNAIKIAMNVMRDGIGGLFKVQPPVIK
jgi:hypothetical protein